MIWKQVIVHFRILSINRQSLKVILIF